MNGYTRLGRTGLTTSRVGFGGYRVDDETPEHRRALSAALGSGINLIDTSTNYTNGASERLVGSVLEERVGAGDLAREEVIVVSKIGYLQGRNLEEAQKRADRGEGYPEIVRYQEGVWHCIHPEFLSDQLDRSLDRLGLETLDICLLHNPEYYLMDVRRRREPVRAARDEFYRRLEQAFAHLEAEVSAGRISWYGVSSNTVARPDPDPEGTSLSRILEAARGAAGDDHHFAILQLPLNLLESGAVFERKEGPEGGQTVLEAATAADVGVLVNRPLNAFIDHTLVRLADIPGDEAGKKLPPIEEGLARLAEMEEAFRERIASGLRTPEGAPPVEDYFRWSEQLRRIHPQVRGFADWSATEGQVRYAAQALAAGLDRSLGGDVAARWRDWREQYTEELDRTLRAIRRSAAESSRARIRAIRETIDPLLPPERRQEPLARVALWTVASTPGVSCALNGMRRVEYVEDAAPVLRWPELENPAGVYSALEQHSI